MRICLNIVGCIFFIFYIQWVGWGGIGWVIRMWWLSGLKNCANSSSNQTQDQSVQIALLLFNFPLRDSLRDNTKFKLCSLFDVRNDTDYKQFLVAL